MAAPLQAEDARTPVHGGSVGTADGGGPRSADVRTEDLRIESRGLAEASGDLSDAWRSFRLRAGGSPFHHPEHLALWGRAFDRTDACEIVTAWRDGDLVGYAPLMIATERIGPLSARCLRFIGNNVGVPGDLLFADVLAVPPARPIVRTLLGHAAGGHAKVWDLGFVPAGSETATLAPGILGSPHGVPPPETKPYVSLALPPTWDGFLTRLSPNARRNFLRRLKRLMGAGDVRVAVSRTPERVRRVAAAMVRNHEAWATGTERETWMGGPRAKRFLADGAAHLASTGEFLAFALELDGQPIAWNLGAYDGVRYYEQTISYDHAYKAYAPGATLGTLVVQHLIELGARTLELGPGLDERKQGLGGEALPFARVRGYRGWLGALSAVRRAWRGASL